MNSLYFFVPLRTLQPIYHHWVDISEVIQRPVGLRLDDWEWRETEFHGSSQTHWSADGERHSQSSYHSSANPVNTLCSGPCRNLKEDPWGSGDSTLGTTCSSLSSCLHKKEIKDVFEMKSALNVGGVLNWVTLSLQLCLWFSPLSSWTSSSVHQWLMPLETGLADDIAHGPNTLKMVNINNNKEIKSCEENGS